MPSLLLLGDTLANTYPLACRLLPFLPPGWSVRYTLAPSIGRVPAATPQLSFFSYIHPVEWRNWAAQMQQTAVTVVAVVCGDDYYQLAQSEDFAFADSLRAAGISLAADASPSAPGLWQAAEASAVPIYGYAGLEFITSLPGNTALRFTAASSLALALAHTRQEFPSYNVDQLRQYLRQRASNYDQGQQARTGYGELWDWSVGVPALGSFALHPGPALNFRAEWVAGNLQIRGEVFASVADTRYRVVTTDDEVVSSGPDPDSNWSPNFSAKVLLRADTLLSDGTPTGYSTHWKSAEVRGATPGQTYLRYRLADSKNAAVVNTQVSFEPLSVSVAGVSIIQTPVLAWSDASGWLWDRVSPARQVRLLPGSYRLKTPFATKDIQVPVNAGIVSLNLL